VESPLFRPESTAFRQRAVLVTGLASALVLAAAAWQPFADPSASARIERARLASEAAEGIVAEWEWMSRSPELPIADSLQADVPRGAAWRGPPLAAEPASERGAARVLLAEADRVELTRNDLREALAIVEEALTKTPTRQDLARAHLRGIQIALRLGRAADARRHFEAAVALLDGTELVDGASALALAVLAIDGATADDAGTRDAGLDLVRATACTRLAELSAAGALVLPGADPRLVRDVGHFVLASDPRREAFAEMLAARCSSGDAFAVSSRAARRDLRTVRAARRRTRRRRCRTRPRDRARDRASTRRQRARRRTGIRPGRAVRAAQCYPELDRIRTHREQRAAWEQRKRAGATKDAAIGRIVVLLDSPDAATRAQAVRSLATLGAVEELPRVLQLVKDPDPAERSAAQRALEALNASTAAPR
jgi:tetratricopeptide (TPR) repeat protein